jgi:GNAT superfamily N-acetyltransferase
MPVDVRQAVVSDAPVVAEMVGELLREIMSATAATSFRFSQPATEDRLRGWLDAGAYTVLLAEQDQVTVGFLALTETRALYAEGAFGTIPELYVKPAFRSSGLGTALLAAAKEVAGRRGWKRLEVTTPPLPEFNRTLAFYQRQGFGITGGRKMKLEVS